MSTEITADRVVAAAESLEAAEFTRAELAARLDVKRSELKPGFRDARQAGRIETTGKGTDGNRRFRLARPSA